MFTTIGTMLLFMFPWKELDSDIFFIVREDNYSSRQATSLITPKDVGGAFLR